MTNLISGKEALIALANGEEVEYFDEKLNEFVYMDMTHHFNRKFRRKPRTVTLNGVEVPAPFLPEEGELFYHVSPEYEKGYAVSTAHERNETTWQQFGAWRTEEEIKQVVAALRQILEVRND